MNLTAREIDKLYVYQIAARDGIAECMELGKTIVIEQDCMAGVRERLGLLQVEATFLDGSKLVSCHDPIGV